MAKLVEHPDVQWTDVRGLRELYGLRPVRVSDAVVLKAAEAVVANGGPTFTDELSAAELLYLLARRVLRPAEWYETPQVLGPLEAAAETAPNRLEDVPPEVIAGDIVRACQSSGALPVVLAYAGATVSPEAALLRLAGHALGRALPPGDAWRLSVEAIPGVTEAIEKVRGYRNWRIHGPEYHQPGIIDPFRRQCWTLKPAVRGGAYGEGVEVGRLPQPHVRAVVGCAATTAPVRASRRVCSRRAAATCCRP